MQSVCVCVCVCARARACVCVWLQIRGENLTLDYNEGVKYTLIYFTIMWYKSTEE